MINKVLLLFTAIAVFCGCSVKHDMTEKPIHAFGLDYCLGAGDPHGMVKPGLWADADPEVLINWFNDLGCNVVWGFAVTTNGYAWYKNGIIPAQPGLKYDLLPEMVKLGHKKNMKVIGYFCVGSNNKWETDHPDLCYHMDGLQIPS